MKKRLNSARGINKVDDLDQLEENNKNLVAQHTQSFNKFKKQGR